MSREERQAQEEQAHAERYCEILEEIPFWANGKGFVSLERTHAFLFTPSTGQLVDLTPGPLDIAAATLNEDKTKALCVGQEFQGKRPQTSSLYVLDLVEGQCCASAGFRTLPVQVCISWRWYRITTGSAMQSY